MNGSIGRKFFATPIALSLALCAASLAQAQRAESPDFAVGDPAPPLELKEWVHGKGIGDFEAGKVYAVHFFSSREADAAKQLARVSEFATANPELTVISVAVNEPDGEKLKAAVSALGDALRHDVAIDDAENGAALAWLAVSRTRMPVTFVIDRDRCVAGFGDLVQARETLQRIDKMPRRADGDDIEREREKDKVKVELERTSHRLAMMGDNVAAAKSVDKLLAKYPRQAAFLLGNKFEYLVAAEQYDEAYQVADECAKYDDAPSLNEVAWIIVDNPGVAQRDFERAMRFATRAVERTQRTNGANLDTLARVYFEIGEIDRAIELQKEALSVAKPPERAELEAAMARYLAALPK